MAKYTVSNYPRDNLTTKTRGILDALAANPKTANIGVNSGYRDPGHNKKAGGASKSQHIHGNAIDLDISGLSAAQKKEALDTATAAGAKGIGIYSSGNSLHLDPRKQPTVWGPSPRGKYRGLQKKEWGLIPDWARPTVDAVFGGFNPQPNASLPETMQAPQTRQQAMFTPPSRPVSLTPHAALASLRGPAMPGGLSQISRAPLGPATSRPTVGPARENPPSAPRSMPSRPVSLTPSRTAVAAPRGAVDAAIDGPLGLSGGSMLGASMARNVAAMSKPPSVSKQGLVDAYSQYGQTRTAADVAAAQAAQYAAFEANRAKALSAMPANIPAKPPAHPISVPPAPVNVPPAPVLAPSDGTSSGRQGLQRRGYACGSTSAPCDGL